MSNLSHPRSHASATRRPPHQDLHARLARDAARRAHGRAPLGLDPEVEALAARELLSMWTPRTTHEELVRDEIERALVSGVPVSALGPERVEIAMAVRVLLAMYPPRTTEPPAPTHPPARELQGPSSRLSAPTPTPGREEPPNASSTDRGRRSTALRSSDLGCVMIRDDAAKEAVRRACSDPWSVAYALGIKGLRRDGRRVRGLCPVHDERTPSWSAEIRDGSIVWHCFGCQTGGDVFALVQAVLGVDFPRALEWCANHGSIDLARTEIERVCRVDAPQPRLRRPPPPRDEVQALWACCIPCSSDAEVSAWLRSRAIDPEIATQLDLVRALPAGPLPRWAGYRGDLPVAMTWAEIGYRAIFPLFDHEGELRSVRARLTRAAPEIDGLTAKSLPPAGFGLAGLVLANPLGRMALAIEPMGWPFWASRRVVITEGEPDFLTVATYAADPRSVAVLGLCGSGQWSDEIAARIHDDSHVLIRTDEDPAGDTYAAQIAVSFRGRCDIAETDPAGRERRRRAEHERKAQLAAEARRGRTQVQIPAVTR